MLDFSKYLGSQWLLHSASDGHDGNVKLEIHGGIPWLILTPVACYVNIPVPSYMVIPVPPSRGIPVPSYMGIPVPMSSVNTLA